VQWSDLYVKLCHQCTDEDKIKFTLEVYPENLDTSCTLKKLPCLWVSLCGRVMKSSLRRVHALSQN